MNASGMKDKRRRLDVTLLKTCVHAAAERFREDAKMFEAMQRDPATAASNSMITPAACGHFAFTFHRQAKEAEDMLEILETADEVNALEYIDE